MFYKQALADILWTSCLFCVRHNRGNPDYFETLMRPLKERNCKGHMSTVHGMYRYYIYSHTVQDIGLYIKYTLTGQSVDTRSLHIIYVVHGMLFSYSGLLAIHYEPEHALRDSI